eukprot:30716-Pelagococcus_subviridis.AAC.8
MECAPNGIRVAPPLRRVLTPSRALGDSGLSGLALAASPRNVGTGTCAPARGIVIEPNPGDRDAADASPDGNFALGGGPLCNAPPSCVFAVFLLWCDCGRYPAARVVPWFTPLAYVLGRSICAPLGPVIVTPASKDFRSGLFVVVAFAFGPPPGPPERRPPLSPFAPAAETAPGWLATINGFPVPDVVFVGFAEDFPAAAAFDRDDEDESPPPPPDCGPPWLGSSVRGVVP